MYFDSCETLALRQNRLSKADQFILRLVVIVTTVVRDVPPILHLAPHFAGSVVLPVGGALGCVAKDLDGILHTAFDVNL